MEILLTHQTVSMTELRNPSKVLEDANHKPIAVMNRNQVSAYLIPVEAVQDIQICYANEDELNNVISSRKSATANILKYLEDK
jgi:PHD/YefM family antitoxin component YafN of YafNO toxin-antitoxin module